MAVEPENPIVQIIRILAGLLLFFSAMSQTATPPTDQAAPPPSSQAVPTPAVTGNTFESLTVIEKVDPTVLESNPAQISLRVSGYQPDGCKFPVQVEQTREGNTVHVKIYRNVPKAVMCTMQLVMYDETITLDGSFPSGEYTIDVNGTQITVKV
jgi:hypothetical protein